MPAIQVEGDEERDDLVRALLNINAESHDLQTITQIRRAPRDAQLAARQGGRAVVAKPQHRTPEHRAERKRIDQAQARGEILICVEPICVMGSREIYPNQAVDVCHDPTGTIVTGPGHSRCNRREGAARGNRARKTRKALQAVTTLRW